MTQQAHGTFPPALDGLKLKRGTGKRDYDAEGMAQVCIMQAVAWFAGEENTDRPQCACEALTSYMIRLNDKMSDEMRQKLKPFIPRLVGTRSTPEIRKQRAQFLAQVAINEFAPNALRSAAKNLGKYPEHAAKLEDFAKQLAAVPEGRWADAGEIARKARDAAAAYADAAADAADAAAGKAAYAAYAAAAAAGYAAAYADAADAAYAGYADAYADAADAAADAAAPYSEFGAWAPAIAALERALAIGTQP